MKLSNTDSRTPLQYITWLFSQVSITADLQVTHEQEQQQDIDHSRPVLSSWLLVSPSLSWTTCIFSASCVYLYTKLNMCILQLLQLLCPFAFTLHRHFISIVYI